MIQDTLKVGLKYSTVPRVQERVSERASEGRSAEQETEEQSEWMSEWPITNVPILRGSESL